MLFACRPVPVAEESVISETVTPLSATPELILTPTQTIEIDTESPSSVSDMITLWHPFSGQEADIIDRLVSRFNESEPQAKVVAISYADDEILMEAVLSAAGSEALPDVFIAPSFFLQTMMQQSYLAVIEAEQESRLIENLGGSIFPIFWGLDLQEGERFGVPFLQHGAFLFYNNTWAQELGFEEKPANPEAFRAQNCAAFNQNRFDSIIENDGTGGYFYPADPIALLSWLQVFNGGVDFNNRGEIILTTAENEGAMAYVYGLFAEDCAWWTSKQDTPFEYFKNRNTLTYSGWSNDMVYQGLVMAGAESDDTWIPIPYPATNGKPIIYFRNYSFAIMEKESVESEAILPFIEWMLQSDQHLELVYQTAAFPLNALEIQEADETWGLFPVWRETLQYIPFLEPLPTNEGWYYTEKILDDLRWQIIQFGVTEVSLPSYLEAAEALGNNLILENSIE